MMNGKVIRFDQPRGERPVREVCTIQIERNVPLPRFTRNTAFRDGMRMLEVGDSFLHPDRTVATKNVRSSVSRMGKTDLMLRGRVFRVAQVPWEDEKGAFINRTRIWRTK